MVLPAAGRRAPGTHHLGRRCRPAGTARRCPFLLAVERAAGERVGCPRGVLEDAQDVGAVVARAAAHKRLLRCCADDVVALAAEEDGAAAQDRPVVVAALGVEGPPAEMILRSSGPQNPFGNAHVSSPERPEVGELAAGRFTDDCRSGRTSWSCCVVRCPCRGAIPTPGLRCSPGSGVAEPWRCRGRRLGQRPPSGSGYAPPGPRRWSGCRPLPAAHPGTTCCSCGTSWATSRSRDEPRADQAAVTVILTVVEASSS